MNKICKKCGKDISEGRLKALPKTEMCVDCSNTNKEKGLKMVPNNGPYTDLEKDKFLRGGFIKKT